MSTEAAMKRVGVVGASGYTGAELLRLLDGHPNLELVVATGDSKAGTVSYTHLTLPTKA